MRRFWKSTIALVATVSLLQCSVIPAAFAGSNQNYAPSVTAQPNVGMAKPSIGTYFNAPATDPVLPKAAMVALLQKKIKYVFIIFNENHSFDNEYGTFPGANGIYSNGLTPRSPANTPGFTQTYIDKHTGATVKVQPFLIGPEYNSSATDGTDHAHTSLATKIDVNPATGVARMDMFASEEYNRCASLGGAANEAEGTQFARLVMSHIDCNTIPFFWNWASHFTIFDNIFSTENTSSTPNAIAMIAGQSGETQWVKRALANTSTSQLLPLGSTTATATGMTQGPPIVNDPMPFYGSRFDTTPSISKQPSNPPKESDGISTYSSNPNVPSTYNIASILTFASLPLTFQGSGVGSVLGTTNRNPAVDLPDIQNDIPYIQNLNPNDIPNNPNNPNLTALAPVNWGWYQEGYDLENTDTNGVASYKSYVTHHNGPQYFGYIADTPAPSLAGSLHGLADFFTDISTPSSSLVSKGGVFYIRGGYMNQPSQPGGTVMTPPITNPSTPAAEVQAIIAAKSGDDDHPISADRQISEAMAARVINAIATAVDQSNNTIWSQCAIIIAYDEGDGFYDHVRPRILSYGPDGLPLSRGRRTPLILISPFARTHAVSHAEGDHNSVIQTISAIFGLPALASLPDEADALAAGNAPEFNQFAPAGFEQNYLGPRDINSSITEDLLSGFSPKRLQGTLPPLPASFALIPDSVVNTLPHYNSQGCQAIGITPEDVRQGIVNHVPAGFNPLPATWPEANY